MIFLPNSPIDVVFTGSIPGLRAADVVTVDYVWSAGECGEWVLCECGEEFCKGLICCWNMVAVTCGDTQYELL